MQINIPLASLIPHILEKEKHYYRLIFFIYLEIYLYKNVI